jgi:gliding motility-associated-like protein
MRFRSLLSLSFLLSCMHLFSQNIAGYWQGVLYQPNGPFTVYFPYSMQLLETGNTITGTAYIIEPNSTAYALFSISGTITNNIYSFQVQQIVSQIAPTGGIWCIETGTLTYSNSSETLTGPWNAPTCNPGTIALWRLKVTSDSVFCEGEPIQLSVTGQNVKWYSDSTLTQLIDTGNIFTPSILSTTKYYVTQTHYNTQSPAVPITISIKTRSFSIIDQTICQGQTYLGYNKSGTYIDSLPSTSGCDSIRTLYLTVLPSYITTIDTVVCFGQTVLGHEASGTYTDTFRAINGCDSISTLILSVKPFPSPNFGTDTTLCLGGSLIISPGSFDSYLWQDGSMGSNYTVKQPGLYSVTVSNLCGYAKDVITILGNDCNIAFPSAFTPNHDGHNDVFKVVNGYTISTYHLLIYNRWGQKIFETMDYSKGWDGTLSGIMQNAGTYAWYCEFRTINNPIPEKRKGTVLLIR